MSRAARDPNLAALVERIARERGFGFDAYKESCLRRRVAVRMRARGVTSYPEYAALLERDPIEYERLLDALTINVTKFYRNKETWDALVHRVLPDLWASRKGRVRCWSAGCASGEEPYTLAILLLEQARRNGHAAAEFRIDATDFDRKSLDRAARGTYAASAFDELPSELLSRYFSDRVPRKVRADVREAVRFHRHDITRDPPPAPPYDLIICRNVLIYFDRGTQERLVSEFVEALVAGGVLVLGRAETLCGDVRSRLELEDARERIYRRP